MTTSIWRTCLWNEAAISPKEGSLTLDITNILHSEELVGLGCTAIHQV